MVFPFLPETKAKLIGTFVRYLTPPLAPCFAHLRLTDSRNKQKSHYRECFTKQTTNLHKISKSGVYPRSHGDDLHKHSTFNIRYCLVDICVLNIHVAANYTGLRAKFSLFHTGSYNVLRGQEVPLRTPWSSWVLLKEVQSISTLKLSTLNGWSVQILVSLL